MSNLAFEAMQFARRAHRAQQRKYTGNPYSNHLTEVAGIGAAAGGARRHPSPAGCRVKPLPFQAATQFKFLVYFLDAAPLSSTSCRAPALSSYAFQESSCIRFICKVIRDWRVNHCISELFNHKGLRCIEEIIA